ncbi:MAG: flagellar motor switch protein FliM [Candidatus Sericytochromatia bacterium]|nr:flagellar motor switch protein FliM [Candidatus Sericytochromatia bacterium]
MAEILSQNEIDALLSALSTGELTAEKINDEQGSREKNVRVYDFKRQNKFSKEHIRTLSMIHENFARILSTVLSAHLRMVVQIEVASVEQLTYDEFIRSLPSPTIVNIFSIDPLVGNCIFEINLDIASAIIDRMLGGPGKVSRMRRDLTEIERALVGTIVLRAHEAFKEAWSTVVTVNPKQESMETNPRFIQIVPPTDVVVLITFEAKFGESSGPLSICIPYVVLEPVINMISSQMMFTLAKQQQSPEHARDIRQKVEQAKIPFQVLLGTAELTVGDILRVGVGDVIPLNSYVDDDLPVLIADTVKFRARPGLVRNKLAVQLTRVIADRELEDE